MNIWLVKVGEPIPGISSKNPRLLRTGELAYKLSDLGAKVTWWTSTFDHVTKKNYFGHDHEVTVSDNFKINLINSTSYSKNISIKRAFFDYCFTKKLLELMAREPLPDAIYCAYPPIYLARKIIEFAQIRGIPSLIDARDLWPDIFFVAAPLILKPFALLGLSLQKHHAQFAFKNATVITGITSDYLNWGLKYAQRNKTELDQAYPLASTSLIATDLHTSSAMEFWHNLDVTNRTFNIVFLGVLSNKINIIPYLKAFRQIKLPNIRLVIGGTGEQLAKIRELSAGDPRIILPGWLDAPQIRALLSISSLGLAPYADRLDFRMSLPSKVIEYLAYGLPILTALSGQLEALIKTKNIGYFCETLELNMLVKYLTEIISDQDDISLKQKNCKSLFDSEFDSDIVYTDMAKKIIFLANKQ